MGDNKFPNLNSEQADNLVGLVKEMFGGQASKTLEGSGLNVNYMVRFMYISRLCQKKREEKGLDLKTISSKLKVPQYKLKYIEESGIGNVNTDVLEKYINYLGLEKEFNEWLNQNKDVYEQLCKSKK
jgi:hypothetical protein